MSKQPRNPRRAPRGDDPEAPEPPEFEPARPRRRSDGWTPERQARFMQALAERACVEEACRAVGMSAQSVYVLRARADAVSFRNAWDAALEYAIRRRSDAASSRAINGVAVPVFFRGEQIGEKRYFDERLAMFLLRYRDPLRYGKWLDRREFGGHPEGAAIDLAAAKRAIWEDAGLSADAAGERVAPRHEEIAERMRLMERAERARGDPTEGEKRGDVS